MDNVTAIKRKRNVLFGEDSSLPKASSIGRVGKGEFHPQTSHRTVLDTLASHGSS